MAKNLTPAHLRCGAGISCQSVHELEDGRLLIVGERAMGGDASTALYEIAKILETVGRMEAAIIIDRELLANLSPWQPISTAPKDGTPVDLWIVPSGISGTGPGRCPDCWHSNGKWWRYDEAFGDGECKSEVANATHWQPLPLPPEGGVAAGAALQSGNGGEELDRGLPRQLTIHFCARDGMLSAFSDDVPDFYISGTDPDAVLSDIAPVLTKILADNYGKTVPEYCNRMVGLLSQLTEGQRAALFAYDGPEYLGGENRSPDEEPQGGDTVPAASTEASLTRPFKDTVIDRMMSDREFCEALLDEQKSALAEAVQAERARIEAIVTDVMDECSAKMHKYFAREQDTSAEVFRLRMEGAARVAQKLGMLVPADEDASAIRKEDATNG